MTEKVAIDLGKGLIGEGSLQEVAEMIYGQVYRDIDDKRFRQSKTSEIRDWLSDGDLSDRPSLESLVEDWKDYDKPVGKDEA